MIFQVEDNDIEEVPSRSAEARGRSLPLHVLEEIGQYLWEAANFFFSGLVTKRGGGGTKKKELFLKLLFLILCPIVNKTY